MHDVATPLAAQRPSMTVEELPEGLRVTLRRNTRGSRQLFAGLALSVAAVTAGVTAWFWGDTVVFIGSEIGQALAGVLTRVPEIALVLIAVTVTGLLGLLVRRMARAAGSAGAGDTLLLKPGEWTLQPAGRARPITLNPAKIVQLDVTPDGARLYARTETDWVLITDAGAPPERDWLRDELERRLGPRGRRRQDRQRYAIGDATPPPQRSVLELGDGGAIVTPNLGVRLARVRSGLGFLAAHAYLVFKLFPHVLRGPLIGGRERTLEFWLLVALFAAAAIALLAWIGYCAGSWTEWRLGRDRFSLVQRIAGWRRERTLSTETRILVTPLLSGNQRRSSARFALELGSEVDDQRVRLLGPASEDEAADTGRWLAHRTGWPLLPSAPAYLGGDH